MENKSKILIIIALLLVVGLFSLFSVKVRAQEDKKRVAPFREYPIGEEIEKNHMVIAAVWLPPVEMECHKGPLEGTIHVEADIHATEGNPNGFAAGEWIPYLTVKYEWYRIEDLEKNEKVAPVLSGEYMPMVAKDGPHYGASVKEPAKGEYLLRYTIFPPSYNGFGRHMDPVTGVDPWWEPFAVEFEFYFGGLKSQEK